MRGDRVKVNKPNSHVMDTDGQMVVFNKINKPSFDHGEIGIVEGSYNDLYKNGYKNNRYNYTYALHGTSISAWFNHSELILIEPRSIKTLNELDGIE